MTVARGFTYVEVLIALVIAGLLALAAGGVLLTSLRAERSAQDQRELRFLLQSVATRTFLGLSPTGALDQAASGWRLQPLEVVSNADTNAPRWRSWELAPPDGSALRLRLSVQSELGAASNALATNAPPRP
jgi:prepilin-type N-terminal cleavage/methylation domain-containing protein